MIGKSNVSSILNYNAVGFDMDFTFIEYRLNAFLKLVSECAIDYLIRQGFPKVELQLDQKTYDHYY